MTIVLHEDLPTTSPYLKSIVRAIVGKDVGAVSLTVLDTILEPGGRVPMHIHPGHEEAVVVVEGTIEAVLGDETRTVLGGATIIAPQGVPHQITNTGATPARVMGIFPTVDVTRQLL